MKVLIIEAKPRTRDDYVCHPNGIDKGFDNSA